MEAQGIDLVAVLVYAGMCALLLGSGAVAVVVMLLMRRNR